MSLDWIKIEHSLPTKPEVMELAAILGIHELQVVGHLVCFWTWCDENMSLDCPAVYGTKTGLDRVAGRDGFVDAMVEVGWLKIEGGKVSVPNYDHHLSQSAKTRAYETKKKHRQRMSRKCPDSSGTKTGQKQGLEKRREDIHTHAVGHATDKAFASLFQKFINHSETTHGWTVSNATSEQWLYKLADYSIEEATEALNYSLERGVKTPFSRGEWKQQRLLSSQEPEPEKFELRTPKPITRSEPYFKDLGKGVAS